MSAAARLIAVLTLSLCPAWLIADGPVTSAPSANEPGIIVWRDAARFIGRDVYLQGRVVQTSNIGSLTFLNFDRDRSVTAIVRKSSYRNFPTPPEKLYRGKFVRIRGNISEYRGKPQIEIYKPDQVTVLEKDEPIPAERAAKPLPPAPPAKKRDFTGIVKVACYNVENFFDAHDDPYRRDESTETKPEAQVAKVAEAIRAIDADVLALEEVENRGVLESLMKTQLSDLGYRNVVLFEGNDTRGIDCALVTWLPVGPVTSHRHVEFSDGSGGQMTFRRDLLQVRIEPPNHPSFDVFVVHLKCCGGDDDKRVRRAEAIALRKVVDEILGGNPDARFVICGDFNDKWNSMTMKSIRGEGPTALQGFVDDLPEGAMSYHKPPYLSVIDFIIASPGMAKIYVPKSYRIVAGPALEAASDHFPVTAEFDLSSN